MSSDIEDPIVWLLGALLGALLTGLIVFVITYRRDQSAVVTNIHWMRAIDIEEWRTVQESDWDVPSGGREVRSYSAIHHYDRVRTGTIEECSGTGAQRTCEDVPVYTSFPVYRTKYDYDIERWKVEKTLVRQANDKNPAWPNVDDLRTSATLQIGDERTGLRTSKYTVQFVNDTTIYELDITQERWEKFSIGEHHTLILNIFGRAMDIKE